LKIKTIFFNIFKLVPSGQQPREKEDHKFIYARFKIEEKKKLPINREV